MITANIPLAHFIEGENLYPSPPNTTHVHTHTHTRTHTRAHPQLHTYTPTHSSNNLHTQRYCHQPDTLTHRWIHTARC